MHQCPPLGYATEVDSRKRKLTEGITTSQNVNGKDLL